MIFRKAKPQLTSKQALEARPIRIVDVEMNPLPDGGGQLKVPLSPTKLGRWVFPATAGATKSYEFDAIGVFVWENIDGKTNVEQIIKRLAKRYDLNLREAQVPTVKFLQMLIKRGLVGVPIEKESLKKSKA